MTKLMFTRPLSWIRELVRYVEVHVRSARVFVRRHEAAPRCDVGDRVVVSLTTIPDRLVHIRPTLHSLLDQSRRPDAIVLNLPSESRREGRGYEIPDFFADYGPVEIVRCDRDWGPATKALPTLQRETAPETRIVITDDDQVYPRNLIETLVRASERFPDAVVCSRGFRIPAGLDINLRNTLYGTHLDHEEPIEIVQGSAGYLVRPRFFTKDVFDYSAAPKEAFFQDDIWLCGHLAGRGVDRLVVPFDNCYSRIDNWSARHTLSLWGRENQSGHVDRTMLGYFSAVWRLRD
jgi:hypothetical protein